MRIGVVFPTLEVTDPGAIRDYAQAAEDLGYAHLRAWEHVVGADLRSRPDWTGPATLQAIHEPLVLFGYLAAVTQRLELVTGVLLRDRDGSLCQQPGQQAAPSAEPDVPRPEARRVQRPRLDHRVPTRPGKAG
jgi:hypothetical protein